MHESPTVYTCSLCCFTPRKLLYFCPLLCGVSIPAHLLPEGSKQSSTVSFFVVVLLSVCLRAVLHIHCYVTLFTWLKIENPL